VSIQIILYFDQSVEAMRTFAKPQICGPVAIRGRLLAIVEFRIVELVCGVGVVKSGHENAHERMVDKSGPVLAEIIH
jgi:hypothetical protein